jgi:hypothetical protein
MKAMATADHAGIGIAAARQARRCDASHPGASGQGSSFTVYSPAAPARSP